MLTTEDYREPPASGPMPGAWPFPSDLHYIPIEREPQFADSFRSRYPPQLRGKTFARSAVGFRDQFAFLETPHPITGACHQLPGSARGRNHATRIPYDISRQRPLPFLTKDHKDCVDGVSVPLPWQDEYDSQKHALLVPDICVTPETRVVGNGYHNFWVAVEIMARWHVPGQNHPTVDESSESGCAFSPHSADIGEFHTFPLIAMMLTSVSLGGHGSLYDLRVNIEPTKNSRVVEVIEHEVTPTYALSIKKWRIIVLTAEYRQFTAGCKALVLVNIELQLDSLPQLRGHVRSQSDELMDDLEHQLGSAQCEYMSVNLIYRHSAFSFTSGADDSNGVVKPQTKIRTTFIATLAQHNAASPWSPPPAPTPNRLVRIIAAH